MKPSDLVYNIQIVPYEDEILGKDPLIQTFSTYDKAKDYFDQIIGIYGQKYTYRVFEKPMENSNELQQIAFFQKPEESTEEDNIVMLLTLLPTKVE